MINIIKKYNLVLLLKEEKNLLNYIIRRIIGAIPVLIGVIVVVFILTTIVPGDPARIMMGQRGNPETIEKIRHEMGLDKPLLVRF